MTKKLMTMLIMAIPFSLLFFVGMPAIVKKIREVQGDIEGELAKKVAGTDLESAD